MALSRHVSRTSLFVFVASILLDRFVALRARPIVTSQSHRSPVIMSIHLCPTAAAANSFTANAPTETTDHDTTPPAHSAAQGSALFPLGQVVATPPLIATLKAKRLSVLPFIWRHQTGDWATMDAEDAAANRAALTNGARIFSSFTCDDVTIWVITEADRSSTCVLLPSCY